MGFPAIKNIKAASLPSQLVNLNGDGKSNLAKRNDIHTLKYTRLISLALKADRPVGTASFKTIAIGSFLTKHIQD